MSTWLSVLAEENISKSRFRCHNALTSYVFEVFPTILSRFLLLSPSSSFHFISFSGTSGLDTPGPIHSHHPLLRLHLLPPQCPNHCHLRFRSKTRFTSSIAPISLTELVVFYLEVLVEIRASLEFSLFTSLDGGWLADFSWSRGHIDGMLRLGRYSAWITDRGWIIRMPLLAALCTAYTNSRVTWCDL